MQTTSVTISNFSVDQLKRIRRIARDRAGHKTSAGAIRYAVTQFLDQVETQPGLEPQHAEQDAVPRAH